MKLSDFIAQFLYEQGVRHVFVVSGGAIIHSIDSVARHPGMDYVCVQHEQAAGAAADAYSRTGGKVGAAMVTSGPGATNLTTSICNAYFDSVPCLLICGQVTTPRLRPSSDLRQKGFQETDIVSLFFSITKYVRRVMDCHWPCIVHWSGNDCLDVDLAQMYIDSVFKLHSNNVDEYVCSTFAQSTDDMAYVRCNMCMAAV